MASKRALQKYFWDKVQGLFSKLAPNFYKWGLSRPNPRRRPWFAKHLLTLQKLVWHS